MMETMRKPTAPRILQEIAVSIKTKKETDMSMCVFTKRYRKYNVQ